MKITYLAVVLLLVVSLLSYAQTSDEVVSLLYDIDENRTKYGERVVSIEEFNFGIPGGKNWLVVWEDKDSRFPFIYVVDIEAGEIKFRDFIIGSFSKDTVYILSRFEGLPGHIIGNGFCQIGDFNGEGYDMILKFFEGAGGPRLDILGFHPQAGKIIQYFNKTFDSESYQPPVRFILYKGMQGFMMRRGTGYEVPGGPGWVPDPPPSWAGRWFFYTWDKEQQKFVEIEEVEEDGIESDWHPVSDPVAPPKQAVAAEVAPVARPLPPAVLALAMTETADYRPESPMMPLWAWLAIIGGAAVLVVVVILLVVKRKK
ncbi:MAG: hypothetical protein LBH44_11035 [Treponema sp.]|jgi:hypothetical protein|nr:hypothetical protein [Treponema sp.]